MKISIITAFPGLYESFLNTSLIAQAIANNQVSFNLIRLADLCPAKVRIDEPTAGPGPGMVIKASIIQKGIELCENQFGKGFVIFFSPQGNLLDQPLLKKFATKFFTPQEELHQSKAFHIILICPRYEGVDIRAQEQFADALISIGNYVVMGGDLPAQVFIEALLRLKPEVVGNQDSVLEESFETAFFDYPSYGQEKIFCEKQIPEILRSGNHKAIAEWRTQAACKNTVINRFDWFAAASPSKKERGLALQAIPHHYAALMHTDVLIKNQGVGNTSVTSIDLHDIARSAATYGIKNVFLVTPLEDQHVIMDIFFAFWKSEVGSNYNENRAHAVTALEKTYSLEETITWITQKEGTKPLIIATSAKEHAHVQAIDYKSQKEVWKHNRPVLFLFGTGQGLCDEILAKTDFLLGPLEGMVPFNHLSVRSAAAIIFDRWLGLNPKRSFTLEE